MKITVVKAMRVIKMLKRERQLETKRISHLTKEEANLPIILRNERQ
jgi:hypothetical protein